jgi:hypothetical protein
MKKIVIFILTLVTTMYIIVNPVNAEIKTYNLIALDNNDYTISMKIINMVNFEGYFYTGYTLEDYNISGYAYYKGEKCSTIIFANKQYTIVNGRQTIELLMQDDCNAEIKTLSVEIEGIPEPKKRVYGEVALSDQVFDAYIGFSPEEVIPKARFFGDNTELLGTMTYPDWENTKEGLREFQWIFTPNDSSYEIRTGTIKINFINPVNTKDVVIQSVESEIPTTPSLTATSILLSDMATTYDININNKPTTSSTYFWTSSDSSVIEVNSANGKLKAHKEGKAIVTCDINTDGYIQTLSSEVTVGFDENAPVLSETELSLELGDKFDIDVDNLVSGSKVKFTSSDKSILTVTSKTGKITTVGTGNAYITVTITTPENQVIILRCEVNVSNPVVITE